MKEIKKNFENKLKSVQKSLLGIAEKLIRQHKCEDKEEKSFTELIGKNRDEQVKKQGKKEGQLIEQKVG